MHYSVYFGIRLFATHISIRFVFSFLPLLILNIEYGTNTIANPRAVVLSNVVCNIIRYMAPKWFKFKH